MTFLNHLKKTLGFDYRSLALYRALMGLVVMIDVAYRLPDLTNFYTDLGLVPRSIFITELAQPWSFSFHLANGSFGFNLGLFIVHFILGLMLFLGYKTRWATVGVYLMTCSVHNRNWLVNNGGDDILRAIIFISIFLPLNKYFSLDSALKREKSPLKNEDYFSTWGLTYFFQVFAIYYFSYILKDHAIWRTDYTAVYYASRLDIFSSPLGVWLRNFPFIQTFSSIFTIWLEYLGPILLVFTFVFGRFWWVARLAVVIMFWALHLGIIATMLIGVFPYLCLVMWAIFIPGPVWDKFINHFRKKGYGKLSIYYDGECTFCEKGVRIIREFLLLPEVLIERTQAKANIQNDMLQKNSWVVINEQGVRSFHFSGMIEVVKHSPLLSWLTPLLQTKLISNFGNKIYKWVASHRQTLSRYSQYLEFQHERKEISWLSWIVQLAGAFAFITLLMWNLTTIKKWDIKAPFYQTVTRWFQLYQEWNMFAPYPKMDNIWVEIPAVLSNGKEIELLTGDTDIYSIKNKKFLKTVPNEHWRKFYLNLSERSDYARYYGGYLCREWNERQVRKVPDTTLRKFEIIVYSQPNLLNDEKGAITKRLTWKHWCFDEDYKKENPTY